MFWGETIGIAVLAVLMAAIVTIVVNHDGPTKWDLLLQQCAKENTLTKDYLVCERKVLDEKQREDDDDAESAAIISTTVAASATSTY